MITAQHDQPKLNRQNSRWLALGLFLSVLVSEYAHANVYDWTYTLGNPVHPGTIPLPLLSDSSSPALSAFLAGRSHPAVQAFYADFEHHGEYISQWRKCYTARVRGL